MTTNNNATNGNDSKPWANEPILSKPLYAFDLPKDLLNNLKLRSIDIPTEADEDDGHSRRRVGEEDETSQNDSGCAICPKAPHFRNIAEKRAHVRSDWHRYNVALNKKGRNEDAIAQEAFTKIAEEVSSAEESETEPEGEINVRVPVDLVNTLLKRLQLSRSAQGQTDATSDEEGEEQEKGKNSVAREPHLWFHTPPSETAKAIPQTQFGIIRQLFPENDVDHSIKDWHSQALSRMQPGPLQSSLMQGAKRLKGASAAEEAASILNVVFYDAPNRRQDSDSEEESDYDDEEEEKEEGSSALSSSHSTSLAPQPMRTWTILLMGGGDFAALVVALNPYEQMISKKKGTTERQLLVIARKQFHRYTTRRKQGGAQSAQDASGRFAKSAGAQLRRYGEQQLAEEIRELLDRPEWRNAIQSSERVWIRAGLRSARGVLWSWPSSGGSIRESPLEEMRRKDLVQSLPIAVRKPTVGECLRCFAELTKVRIRHETEEEMQKRDEAYKAQLQGTAQARQERRQKQKERLQREAEMKQAASTKKRTPIKLDPVEQLRRERLIRLVDMLRKGRLNNSIKHLEKYELDLLHPNGWQNDAEANFDPDDVDESMELARQRINAELPEWWRFLDAREKGALLHGPPDSIESQLSNLTIRNRLVPSTILQVAAEGGSESVVNHFLVERHCDPTIGISPPPHSDIFDEDATKQEIAIKAKDKASTSFPHRTAFDLCPNRESRDVFRRLMATRSDLCKDWSGMEKGGARVPKALTEEMEEARNKEEQVRDKRQLMRERARKRQEEETSTKAHTITEEDRLAAIANQRVKKDVDQQSSTSNTNRLGGSSSAPRALQKKMDESQGLTPEMRARIEREKRARAAEARLKGLQGN